MSVQSMAWAISQQEVRDPSARHVLLVLSNYTGVDGTGAFPSSATLARDTGLSERCVRAKLDQLEAAGLIRRGLQGLAAVKIARADRRPVVYDVAIERGAPDAPREQAGDNPRKPVDNPGDKNGHGVHLTPSRGARGAPNPKALPVKPLEPVIESREAKAARRDLEGLQLSLARDLIRGTLA